MNKETLELAQDIEYKINSIDNILDGNFWQSSQIDSLLGEDFYRLENDYRNKIKEMLIEKRNELENKFRSL